MPDLYGEYLAACRHASKHHLCRRNLLPGGCLRLCPVLLKVCNLITPLLYELLIPGIILIERVLLFEVLKTVKHVLLPHGVRFCISHGAFPEIRV
jgi:hypothetical protein